MQAQNHGHSHDLDGHPHDLEEVIVTSHPLAEGGLSQSSIVLSGDKLSEELESSLGETLANSAGIRSASFGGAVGRPVIHGLGGPRIKTTEDRIDSLDVSVTSTDHAVTVEPFIANSVTVLKGSSTLIYGSGAIGGVVDTETGRIPSEVPEAIEGRIELRGADNANATTGAVRLDGGAGENFAWHLDAFSKSADDYDIAGELESAALIAAEEAEAQAAGEEREEEEESDTLEGSNYDVDGGAIGFSFIGDQGFVGVSVSTTNANYGLVGGHHEEEDEEGEEHDEEEEEEEAPGFIDLEQTRVDLEAQLNNPFAGIKKINARFGVNDYEHSEVEGNGEIGTLFDNDAWEGRLEVTHEAIFGFDGAFGIQLSQREFSAIGEEAFVPPTETDSSGIFWVGERDLDTWKLEVGARFDSVDNTSLTSASLDRDFSTVSSSIGVLIPTGETSTWSALLDYSQRAPSIEELYSDGPHLATQSFEIGDPDLEEETGLSLSLTWNYQNDVIDAHATLYHNEFDGFIYEVATGEEEDELPVLAYRQNDASFTGLDLELGVHLFEVLQGDMDLTFQFDTVSAEVSIDGNDALPRIPADRVGAGLSWENDVWKVLLNYKHVSSQTDVTEFELPTESYDDVSARISRSILFGEQQLSFFIAAKNLTDEEQREHVSFVKDLAPQPGRTIEAGLRFKF